ncbi:MAG: aminoglycoside phosphotransferase family protein [Chloroflexota bacterium]
MHLPEQFVKNMRHGLGDAGDAWLRSLPAVISDLAQRWQFTLGEPFPLSFNYVTRAILRDGTEAVFKVGPWGRENVQEIAALRLYAGIGACRLLAADESLGACLLERVRPGTMLREVAEQDDDEATRIAAGLMCQLWRPAAEIEDRRGLRHLSEWFLAFGRHRAYYDGPGPFSERVLSHAERMSDELMASAPPDVLLHADFHHENVLRSERAGWLVIDPKGMLGDPGYEVGSLLLNPDPESSPPKSAAMLARRLDILAESLGYDRQRLRLWGIVHAVMSACWSAENDGDGWQNAIIAAERLLDLPG